jgi:hypothetical protein
MWSGVGGSVRGRIGQSACVPDRVMAKAIATRPWLFVGGRKEDVRGQPLFPVTGLVPTGLEDWKPPRERHDEVSDEVYPGSWSGRCVHQQL